MMRLPAGWSSISMPGSSLLVAVGRTSSRPLPPGKSVATTSAKCCSTARVRLREALLDRLRQLGAQLLELRRASRSRSSRSLDQLLEPLLLARVLLGGERVDLAELLPAAREPLDLRAQRVAPPRRPAARPRASSGSRASDLLALALEPGRLDLDLREPLGRLGRLAAQLRLAGAQLAEPLAEPRPTGCRPRRRAPRAQARTGGRPTRPPLEQRRRPARTPRRGASSESRARLGAALRLGAGREPRLAAARRRARASRSSARAVSHELGARARVVHRRRLPAARGADHDLLVRRRRLRERKPWARSRSARRGRAVSAARSRRSSARSTRASQPVEARRWPARAGRRPRRAPPRPARRSSSRPSSFSSRRRRSASAAVRRSRDLRKPTRRAARDRRRRGAPRAPRSARRASAARSAAVAWSASGRRRLRTSVSRSRARSTCVGDAGELQLGAVAAALEPSKPGRLLHERAPLRRLGREDLLDAALADDGVHLAADARGRRAARRGRCGGRRAVHEVAALAAARQAPADRDLRRTAAAPRRRRCRRAARPRRARPARGWRRRRTGRPRASRRAARACSGCRPPRRTASAMFDLPEPFGPTTTATPGSRRTSTGSGNDLKPRRRIERRYTRPEACRALRSEQSVRESRLRPDGEVDQLLRRGGLRPLGRLDPPRLARETGQVQIGAGVAEGREVLGD